MQSPADAALPEGALAAALEEFHRLDVPAHAMMVGSTPTVMAIMSDADAIAVTRDSARRGERAKRRNGTKELLAVARADRDVAVAALAKMRIERDTLARALIAAHPNIESEESDSEWMVEHAIEVMGDALAAGASPAVADRLAKEIWAAERDHAEIASRREAIGLAVAALAEPERAPN